jgi:hypothetical protein
VIDSRGNLVTKPRLIDTCSLVFSKNPLALLGMLLLLFSLSARLIFMITDPLLFFHLQEKCLIFVPW